MEPKNNTTWIWVVLAVVLILGIAYVLLSSKESRLQPLTQPQEQKTAVTLPEGFPVEFLQDTFTGTWGLGAVEITPGGDAYNISYTLSQGSRDATLFLESFLGTNGWTITARPSTWLISYAAQKGDVMIAVGISSTEEGETIATIQVTGVPVVPLGDVDPSAAAARGHIIDL